jgi:hypothetical protein
MHDQAVGRLLRSRADSERAEEAGKGAYLGGWEQSANETPRPTPSKVVVLAGAKEGGSLAVSDALDWVQQAK